MNHFAGIEAFAEVARLIVVAAHPDDLETMCGGTIAMLAQRGVKIFSVNCTLGDIGTQGASITREALAETRLAETRAAADILGLVETYNLGHHDGELAASLEVRKQLAYYYRLTQADALFTFDPYWTGQIHPDHRAAGQAALDAYMPSKMPLYSPEQLTDGQTALSDLKRIFLFSTDRAPEIYVDVTAVYETKMAASMAHQSQFPKGVENLEWMKARDRVIGELIGSTYAEVFKPLNVW
jgi:LmbE family N-acetylglucosaminyl deacetylase